MAEPRWAIDDVPEKPGVYLFRDGAGKVLYVGKARKLKARLRSYRRPGGDGRLLIRFLEEVAVAVETIVTRTEGEALLLEDALIKQHKPPHNIRLKDDKSFLMLAARRASPSRASSSCARTAPRGTSKIGAQQGRARFFGPFAKRALRAPHAERPAPRRAAARLPRLGVQTTARGRASSTRSAVQRAVRRARIESEYASWSRRAAAILAGRHARARGELEGSHARGAEELDYERAAIGAIGLTRCAARSSARACARATASSATCSRSRGAAAKRSCTGSRSARALEREPLAPLPLELPTRAVARRRSRRCTRGGGATCRRDRASRASRPSASCSRRRSAAARSSCAAAAASAAHARPGGRERAHRARRARARAGLEEAALEDLEQLADLRETPEVIDCFDISNLQGSDVGREPRALPQRDTPTARATAASRCAASRAGRLSPRCARSSRAALKRGVERGRIARP
jgi:excinuclease UvrABC nuclease subunit